MRLFLGRHYKIEIDPAMRSVYERDFVIVKMMNFDKASGEALGSIVGEPIPCSLDRRWVIPYPFLRNDRYHSISIVECSHDELVQYLLEV